MRIAIALLLVMLVGGEPAFAHGSIQGLSGMSAGLIHPFFVPGHILVLTALGLMLGQQGYDGLREKLYLFAVNLLAGLILSRLLIISSSVDGLLLLLALIIGAGVALQLPRQYASLQAPLVMITGLLVGASSMIETASYWQNAQALLGTGFSVFVLVYYFAGLAGIIYLDWPDWLRIGIRTVGSWIAAIALLVFALHFIEIKSPQRAANFSIPTSYDIVQLMTGPAYDIGQLKTGVC